MPSNIALKVYQITYKHSQILKLARTTEQHGANSQTAEYGTFRRDLGCGKLR